MKEITIKLQLNLLEHFWEAQYNCKLMMYVSGEILRFQIMTTLREDFVSCYYSLILVLFIFWLEGVCINALPGQFR